MAHDVTLERIRQRELVSCQPGAKQVQNKQKCLVSCLLSQQATPTACAQKSPALCLFSGHHLPSACDLLSGIYVFVLRLCLQSCVPVRLLPLLLKECWRSDAPHHPRIQPRCVSLCTSGR